MAAPAAARLEVQPSLLGTLALGSFEVPYVDLASQDLVHTRLAVGDDEYAFQRSYPIKGHSAVMPAYVAEALAEGRRVLVAERQERYYVYLA
jgi:hypothetical protein